MEERSDSGVEEAVSGGGAATPGIEEAVGRGAATPGVEEAVSGGAASKRRRRGSKIDHWRGSDLRCRRGSESKTVEK